MWSKLITMIFPFSFLGTGRGTFVLSSRFSRRKLCSRRIVLANFGKTETQSLFLSFFLFFFFIYFFLYFFISFFLFCFQQTASQFQIISKPYKKQVLCLVFPSRFSLLVEIASILLVLKIRDEIGNLF
jgi:hypothetical protein